MGIRLPKLALFLGLGLVTSVVVSWLLATLQDVQLGRAIQADSFVNDEQWNVTRYDRAGAATIRSVRFRGLDWSPQQAAGAPDTPTAGDKVTAWASAASDGGTEWLIMDYAKPVIP